MTTLRPAALLLCLLPACGGSEEPSNGGNGGNGENGDNGGELTCEGPYTAQPADCQCIAEVEACLRVDTCGGRVDPAAQACEPGQAVWHLSATRTGGTMPQTLATTERGFVFALVQMTGTFTDAHGTPIDVSEADLAVLAFDPTGRHAWTATLPRTGAGGVNPWAFQFEPTPSGVRMVATATWNPTYNGPWRVFVGDQVAELPGSASDRRLVVLELSEAGEVERFEGSPWPEIPSEDRSVCIGLPPGQQTPLETSIPVEISLLFPRTPSYDSDGGCYIGLRYRAETVIGDLVIPGQSTINSAVVRVAPDGTADWARRIRAGHMEAVALGMMGDNPVFATLVASALEGVELDDEADGTTLPGWRISSVIASYTPQGALRWAHPLSAMSGSASGSVRPEVLPRAIAGNAEQAAVVGILHNGIAFSGEGELGATVHERDGEHTFAAVLGPNGDFQVVSTPFDSTSRLVMPAVAVEGRSLVFGGSFTGTLTAQGQSYTGTDRDTAVFVRVAMP